MVSDLFFYQLMLIALVWLCVMLHWAWPSDSAAVPRRYLGAHPPPPKRHREPKPFAGLTQKPHCDACAHASDPARTPPQRRHHVSCSRGGAAARSTPHAISVRTRTVPIGAGSAGAISAPMAIPVAVPGGSCSVSLPPLFSGDPRHDLAWQARRRRAHRARHRVPGRRLPTICQPRSVKFSPHLHDRLTATSGGIIAGAIMQHRDQETQQPVSNVA